MQSNFSIAPSILSCDFANIERDLWGISSADYAHIDVMDYHFVPNLTFGGPVVKRIIEVCHEIDNHKKTKGQGSFYSDVHLMIADPDRWAVDYAKFGADSVTFHYNASKAPVRLAREIRSLGVKASISVRPAEGVEPLFDILEEFDMILIMTVEPGFGGQKFLNSQLQKIKRLRNKINELESSKRPIIEVDGGVSRNTVELVASAGANLTVAGSAVFGANNIEEEINTIREIGNKFYRDNWIDNG